MRHRTPGPQYTACTKCFRTAEESAANNEMSNTPRQRASHTVDRCSVVVDLGSLGDADAVNEVPSYAHGGAVREGLGEVTANALGAGEIHGDAVHDEVVDAGTGLEPFWFCGVRCAAATRVQLWVADADRCSATVRIRYRVPQ